MLPSLDLEGRLILILEKMLETKVKKLRNKEIYEYLIKWKDLLEEDSTWKGVERLAHPSLNCLKVSNYKRGGFVTSSFENN